VAADDPSRQREDGSLIRVEVAIIAELDADEGAILSQPTRIVGCHEVNGLRIRELRNRLSAGHG